MANILYGVAGEGFGHSSRSHLTGKMLEAAGHNVLFAASNKSYSYLGNYFPQRVSKIHGLKFHYQNASVSLGKTFLTNAACLPEMVKVNYHAFKKLYPKFAPDLVITDFEPFTSLWASMNNVPCISVDHEHLLCKCQYAKPPIKRFAKISSESVAKNYLRGVKEYLILNFFKVDKVKKGAKIINPVVREQLFDYHPSDSGDYIIFYATNESCLSNFLELAQLFPKQRFYLYGFDRQGEYGNCLFKQLNTDEFLYDLSKAQGVMATGGFSLISECLYYRKKMFIKPIGSQIEQMINAYHLAKLGGAMYINNFTQPAIQSFIDWLEEPYSVDNENILFPDNDKYFAALADSINRTTKGKVSLHRGLNNNPQERLVQV